MEIIKDIVIFVVFPLFVWMFSYFSKRIKELEDYCKKCEAERLKLHFELRDEMISEDDVVKIIDAVLTRFALSIHKEMMSDEDVTEKFEAMLCKFELRLIKEKLLRKIKENNEVKEQGGNDDEEKKSYEGKA